MQLLLLFPWIIQRARRGAAGRARSLPLHVPFFCARRRSFPWKYPIASTRWMLGKRRVSFKHNFRNEQVENGGGHVYRSVKRERVANKSFEDIKAIPTSTCAHTLEKRAFLFLFPPSLHSLLALTIFFFQPATPIILSNNERRKMKGEKVKSLVARWRNWKE